MFECQCESGYIGDTCQNEQPCVLSNPCKNNGKCEYLGGDYLCKCRSGYDGNNCEKLTQATNAMKPGYIALIILSVLACISALPIYLYMKRRCQKQPKGHFELEKPRLLE